jgi:hypothetical protein
MILWNFETVHITYCASNGRSFVARLCDCVQAFLETAMTGLQTTRTAAFGRNKLIMVEESQGALVHRGYFDDDRVIPL